MKRTTKCLKQLLIINCSLLILQACSVSKQIAQSAKADVLNTKALETAHVGISIFDPATNKYLYNYQGDKYFVPASNTKLPTCYAAMKYLGDSLVGLRYLNYKGKEGSDTGMVIEATGDPTFLHPDFKMQKVYAFLKKTNLPIGMATPFFSNFSYNSGWPIGDLNESYMPPRSNFPIYGNVLRFNIRKETYRVLPGYFLKKELVTRIYAKGEPYIDRNNDENTFVIYADSNVVNYNKTFPIFLSQEYPWKLIVDTLGKRIDEYPKNRFGGSMKIQFENYTHNPMMVDTFGYSSFRILGMTPLHSQPTDSLLKPMMHNSDNFFAEQSLLMVSDQMLGVMNDERIIDTLLKTDFKDLPQKPRWADGSGLSRYNLFTPQDFVAILNKMKNEFGMDRIKVILPTGGEGTISNYYKADSGYIYGKTGTLSGVVAFSGFLYTKKGKLLIFSTLVNNHQATATEVRKAVEKFLEGIRNKY